MNIRQFFANRSQSRRFHGRRKTMRNAAPIRMEQLEQRTMLAGDVTAQLIGQNAFVTGDAADNSVELVDDGTNLVLRGLNGTTINGSQAAFVLGASGAGATTQLRNLSASLNDGNDSFVIDGASVGGHVIVHGGNGNDQLVVAEASSIGGSLVLAGQSGDDSLSVQDSSVSGNVTLTGNQGNDLLTLSGANIGVNLWAYGGIGNDDIVVDDSRIGMDAMIYGQSGDDDIVLRNSTVVDDLFIYGQAGHDIILIDSSQVGDKSWVFGGIGSDNVLIQGETRFWDRFRAFGGAGRDNVEAASSVVFDGFRGASFRTSTADANAVATRINDAQTGALAAAQNFTSMFGTQISLTVDNASVSEGAGNAASTLTVTRSGDTTEALAVTLESSDEAKLQLEQTSVTIPAGQSSVNVLLNAQDNTSVDGTFTVTITASTEDIGNASIDVDVTDDDGATITVQASQSSIQEDSGNVATIGAPHGFTYTISHNGDTTEALVAVLTTSVDGEISVPSEVTIPAGQSTVVVNAQTVADGDAESDVTVVLTAASPGFQSGSDSITILDNDAARLTVEFSAPTVTETGADAEAVATITRNTDTTNALTVTVTSGDATSLSINGAASQQVTIPAGETSVQVSVFGVEEDIDDGDVSVAVTASATDFTDGSDTIFVTDDDAPTLSVTLPNGSTVAEDAGTGALTATINRNSGDTSSPLTVAISLTGDSRLTGPADVTIPAGSSSVNVTFDAVDNNIVDQPADGTVTILATAQNFASGSADVTVTNDDAATISLTPTSVSVEENAGNSATIALSRTDSSTEETIDLNYSDASLITGPASVAFAVGETTKTVGLTVIDNDSFADNNPVTITASATGHADVTTTVNVVNDESLTISTDTSSNTVAQSVGTLITKAASFVITGVTAPNATVQADNNGDGTFNEATTTADGNGNYSITVPLVHDDNNNGANVVQLRVVEPVDAVAALSDVINVHRAIGTVVRFQTNQDFNNNDVFDFYDIEMLDADAPNTVANFLSYTTDTATGTERFDNLIVQRSPANFVIQAGRYNVTGQQISEVDRDADNNGQADTITNEFNGSNSNVRGTLSMALPSGAPNGGSSEWFINVVDNSFLDQNLHTVFGRVIGDGMEVVDAINDLPIFDLNTVLNQGALSETPLVTSPLTQLSGTISLTADSAVIQGTGTLFASELQVGDFVTIGNSTVQVIAITSDTQLTIDTQANTNQSGLAMSLLSTPQNDDYVIFSNIGEILDQI